MIVFDNLGYHLPQGYLFNEVNLQIKENDRIGLVGKNGAGKSTLLRVISGIIKPTDGSVHIPKDFKIGFLTQDIVIDSEKSVLNYLLDSNDELNTIQKRITAINEALVERTDYESEDYLALLDELDGLNHTFNLLDGFQWEDKVTSTLKGLGFEEEVLMRSLNTFSGGWKMRAELAKLLVNAPDILLLDEPTNHLDIISISWLENYLKTFPGAVILISHDRLFLDNVTNRTLEISMQKVHDYPYAYSKYKAVRAEDLERLSAAKKQQDKDIKHTEELISKFRAKKNKAAFAQTLIKKLEKTERIEIENDAVSSMNIKFPLSIQPGKLVLELKNMGKSFDDKLIFKEINHSVGRGEKIALLGANGQGKSTLLKRITEELAGDGEAVLGHNVNISYFAQDQAEKLNKEHTVYDTVDAIATGEIRSNLRGILGAFLFSGDDIDKKVGVLSGGERTRLALCQLLLSPSNFLILDEPTNHLDIQSKEVLKSALQNFEGTFIVVSHDREFLDGLTNRIWEIADRTLKVHHYGVKEFLTKAVSNTVKSRKVEVKVKEVDSTKSSNLSYQDAKELKRKQNKFKNSINRAEQKIDELEEKIAEMDKIMVDLDYADEKKSNTVLTEYQDLKKQLDEQMMLWESSSEELDKLG
jgi:ATP-binding cassette subfamily F protein 3